MKFPSITSVNNMIPLTQWNYCPICGKKLELIEEKNLSCKKHGTLINIITKKKHNRTIFAQQTKQIKKKLKNYINNG